jgi:hypothetical protein
MGLEYSKEHSGLGNLSYLGQGPPREKKLFNALQDSCTKMALIHTGRGPFETSTC